MPGMYIIQPPHGEKTFFGHYLMFQVKPIIRSFQIQIFFLRRNGEAEKRSNHQQEQSSHIIGLEYKDEDFSGL